MNATTTRTDEPYCHLCCCVRGWLHGYWNDHKPFLEDDCEQCWLSLAEIVSTG